MTERERLIQEVENGKTSVKDLIRTFLKMSMDLYMDIGAKDDEELKEEFLKIMKNYVEG